MTNPLRTLAEVSAAWQRSERTVRRQLVAAMASDRGLRVTRVGRSIMFTSDQLARFQEALAWRSQSAAAAKSGTRGAPSVSVARSSPSRQSALDAVAALTQKRGAPPRKRASVARLLTVLPGGLGA